MPNEQPLSYREAMAQANREALYTIVTAIGVTVFFWGGIGFFADDETRLVALPLWFWLSCIGGYAVSVLAVMALVRFGMKNFDLSVAERTSSKKD